jgi:hypothetical protein
VQSYGTHGNSEAEANAAGGAGAGVVNAEEGLEDLRELIAGDAGATIADRDSCGAGSRAQVDINCFPFRRVANRVADHVFERAAKEFFIAADGDFVMDLKGEIAPVTGGFNGAVLCNIAKETIETDLCALS